VTVLIVSVVTLSLSTQGGLAAIRLIGTTYAQSTTNFALIRMEQYFRAAAEPLFATQKHSQGPGHIMPSEEPSDIAWAEKWIEKALYNFILAGSTSSAVSTVFLDRSLVYVSDYNSTDYAVSASNCRLRWPGDSHSCTLWSWAVAKSDLRRRFAGVDPINDGGDSPARGGTGVHQQLDKP